MIPLAFGGALAAHLVSTRNLSSLLPWFLGRNAPGFPRELQVWIVPSDYPPGHRSRVAYHPQPANAEDADTAPSGPHDVPEMKEPTTPSAASRAFLGDAEGLAEKP